MIRHDCKQGGDEWNMLRCGIPTASVFERIVTPKGALSKQSEDLMHKLVAERILGYPLESVCTAAMEAGRIREPEAAQWYAFERDVDLELVGICLVDSGRYGASPDRMVSGGGLLEIKCPEPKSHCRYLLNSGIGSDYWPQIQGQLLCCEADWLDSVSYCPPFPASLVRVERDEEYIRKLRDALEEFCDRLDAAEARIRSMGVAEVLPTKQQRENQEVWEAWRPTL